MDPRTDHRPSPAHRAKSRGNQRADRCEDDHGVELLGRLLGRIAGPNGPEGARELLCLVVAGPGPGKHPSPLCDRYLADDVRGRPEPVQAERLPFACQS